MSIPNSNSPAQPANNNNKKNLLNYILLYGLLGLMLIVLGYIAFSARNEAIDLQTELATANETNAGLEEAKKAAETAVTEKEEANKELDQIIAGLNAKIAKLEADTSQEDNLEKIANLSAAVDSLGEKLDSLQSIKPSKELAEAKATIAQLEAKIAQMEEAASKGLTAKGGATAPKVEPLNGPVKVVETDMETRPKKGTIYVNRTTKKIQARKSDVAQIPTEFADFAVKEWPR